MFSIGFLNSLIQVLICRYLIKAVLKVILLAAIAIVVLSI